MKYSLTQGHAKSMALSEFHNATLGWFQNSLFCLMLWLVLWNKPSRTYP
jgi:hypothetical protein